MTIEFIMLTMSVKYNGYCVAGINRRTGRWVRLVSANETVDGALYDRDITDVNGTLCKPLDVVAVPVVRAKPTYNQPENVLIDRRYRWRRIGSLSLSEFLDAYPPENYRFLFGNNGCCLNFSQIRRIDHSLLIAKVSSLVTYCNDKNKTKAMFKYRGMLYENISVTDADFFADKNKLSAKQAVVVMSLANKPYNYQFFKFIAKIFLCE